MNGKRRHKITKNQCLVMSTKNRDLIQKICYKKTASVDMTNHGFINDSKVNPVNLLMKPLRKKIENIICGTNHISSPKEEAATKNKEIVGIRKPCHAADSKFKARRPQNQVIIKPIKKIQEEPRKRKVRYEDQQRHK